VFIEAVSFLIIKAFNKMTINSTVYTLRSTPTLTRLFVFLCLGISTLLPAQDWNQIIKAAASDRATTDFFGYSVAISGDYAIVGAYQEDEDAAGGARLGNAGSAYIFKRTGTTWAQEAKIVASDRASGDFFGYSVAISGDYAIVGAYAEDENAAGGATLSRAGSAYIFKRTGTTWAQESKIVASDRAVDDYFGYDVAISGDYAIVGAYNEDENAAGGAPLTDPGSAYIFKRTGTTWAQESKIVASDRATSDFFGLSVAISGDYAIVGAYNEDEDAAGGATLGAAGSAYIFKRTGTTWAQEAKIVASDRSAGDNFGLSVSISGDYVIVGAFSDAHDATGGGAINTAGSAYIFKRTGTTWAQEAKIVASDRAAGDLFGYAVAISGDYAIIGAYQEDHNATGGATLSNAGSAYIFKRTGTTWAQASKIVASDRAANDNFGRSVAISGDYALVGAELEDEDAAGGATASDAGSAYFFNKPIPCDCDPTCSPIPTTAGTYTGTRSKVDGLYTHYCDGNNLLLSIIVPSGTTIPADAVQVKVGATGATLYTRYCGGAANPTSCFMNAATGNALINRFWHINSAIVPGTVSTATTPLQLVFYFTDADFTALNTVLTSNALANKNNLQLYVPKASLVFTMFSDPGLVKPLASVLKLAHSGTPSASSWQLTAPQSGINGAVFKVASITNSGGLGKF
jgi:hypothetical protein